MRYAFNMLIRGFCLMLVCLSIEWDFLQVSSLSVKILAIIVQWIIIMSIVVIVDLILMKVD